LLECLTYRWRGHVGPRYDIDKDLRSQAELDRWMARCPIRMLERHLLEECGIAPAVVEELRRQIAEAVEQCVAHARGGRCPSPNTLLRREGDACEGAR
ncbi:MAG: hypothetical protein IMY84_04350, partial [Chloroflexi bacterium]|nr:hypothetical protein [Chloroflexota bacterium]